MANKYLIFSLTLFISSFGSINCNIIIQPTDLISATLDNNLEAVKTLINSKADINLSDDNDCTALYYAAFTNKPLILQELLNNKADTEKDDNKGLSPLSVAASAGHTEIVKILLAFNEQQNKTPLNSARSGYTPILRAAMAGHQDVVDLLLHSNVCPKGAEKYKNHAQVNVEVLSKEKMKFDAKKQGSASCRCEIL